MRLAIIVGGWYFPHHLFRNIVEADLPEGYQADYFTVAHRNPSTVDISKEMLGRVRGGDKYDVELYTDVTSFDRLRELGYEVIETENVIGDYYFFNQWTELYDYREYDYIVFMHDDNYLLPGFKDVFVDIFENRVEGFVHNGKGWEVGSLNNFSYIANSAVGSNKIARGSFSVWTKDFITDMGGAFPMDNVTLTRKGKQGTPKGHHDLTDWNKVGRNLQNFVNESKHFSTAYRLSKHYRVSKYMIEGERGLVSKVDVLPREVKRGYEKYVRRSS